MATRQHGTPPGEIIAGIVDPAVIEKILKHLGLAEASQTRNRSRADVACFDLLAPKSSQQQQISIENYIQAYVLGR